MDNPNPIRYSDLIKPDDSITKLISQLKELIGEYDAAKAKIQGSASEIVKGMQGVSGATEEQRKAIQAATVETEKLEKQYRYVYAAQMEARKEHLELTAARKEETQITKLLQQLNVSAEGSYNRLSAQYRLNKIRLDEMSKAEREGTEAGRTLVAETNALYQEMKRLQEETGKHQLNVGNYAEAAKGLREELMSLTNQLAYMRMEGKDNSEEYRQMSDRAGRLKDAMMDARAEVKNMASDTSTLDSVMGAATAAGGALSTYTGLTTLLGSKDEDAAEAQKKLQSAIAITNGLRVVQNALQKQSALMVGVRLIQTKAAVAAENMDTAAKGKNIVVTKAATVAQRIFNAVAAANPYVLLAMALITVVGALLAFTLGASNAAKEQKALNEQLAIQLDYLDKVAQESVRANNERVQEYKNELEIAKARNASLSETRALEDKIFSERRTAHNKLMGMYWSEVATVDAHREKIKQLEATLYQLQQAQAKGIGKVKVDVDLDGKMEKVKVDEAIEAIQGQIDNLGRKVQIAVDLKTESDELAKEAALRIEQRKKEARDIAATEEEILRAARNANIALIQDAYTRESLLLRSNADKQISDLRKRLETEANLTVAARKGINEQILLIQRKLDADLEALRDAYIARDTAARRETEDIAIALMEEGADKQREQLRVSYERQIEDLNTMIATRKDLTSRQVEEMYKQMELLGERYRQEMQKLEGQITVERLNAEAERLQLQLDAAEENSRAQIDLTLDLLRKQRDIELAENAQKSEEMKQDELDIRRKWDAAISKQERDMEQKRAMMLLDTQQELAASEFALMDRNERQKTIFKLEQEQARLQKILDLDKKAAKKMTEQERQAIENTIKAIERERGRLPYNNLFELLGLGLDSDQQQALGQALSSISDSISSIVDSWNSAAEAALNAANAQVDAAQRVLEAEIEARNAGYANEVSVAQKELELAQKKREKAQKEQEKAQKAQLALDSAMQASSLITATANIWASLSKVPIIGPALALAAITTMWGSFALAKVRAVQVSKQQTEQYGEGTVELLQGGSHASGHDIDLGTKPNGVRRRAEGGEFFAVINKRNSRRFRDVIPDVINSFNDGTFADRYQRANAAMAGYAVGMVGGTDVSGLEKDVAAIREQGERDQYVDGNGNTIIRYKNLTKKIYRN